MTSAISTAKLLAQLAATPQAPRLPAPAPQPALMPELAEALVAPGWLERDDARRRILQGRPGSPWLTGPERQRLRRQLERD